MINNRENGFTLFEVLISMFITGVALLGLAMMNIYILKSSQSSFNYTVATIRANSFVDDVWLDLCGVESAATFTYDNILGDWQDELSDAKMSGSISSTTDASTASVGTYASSASVTVSWSDSRFTDDVANNSVTMNVQFPSSGCE